jgi:hypothetical protein
MSHSVAQDHHQTFMYILQNWLKNEQNFTISSDNFPLPKISHNGQLYKVQGNEQGAAVLLRLRKYQH